MSLMDNKSTHARTNTGSHRRGKTLLITNMRRELAKMHLWRKTMFKSPPIQLNLQLKRQNQLQLLALKKLANQMRHPQF